MAKRDRLELVFDLLSLIAARQNSMRLTPLMRSANMSSSRFLEYYAELKAKGLVRERFDAEGVKYVTLTDKGFRYLEKYKLVLGILDEFEL